MGGGGADTEDEDILFDIMVDVEGLGLEDAVGEAKTVHNRFKQAFLSFPGPPYRF